MNEKSLAKLVEDYGYAPGNYKYIPHGCEILRCIGQGVIVVTFKAVVVKDENGEETEQWQDYIDNAFIDSIYDYDPMTMTYKVKYHLRDKDSEIVETRIQPEGYEFCDPETTKKFIRIVPYSYHWKMVEDELMIERVKNLFNERDTLSIDQLRTIAESKNQPQILRYSNNIGAAVKLESGKMLWIRLHTLRLKHRQGDTFGLFFSSDDGKEWSFLISADSKEYDFKEFGKFKILDLADYGTEEEASN